jgi:predicted dehydrogenase
MKKKYVFAGASSRALWMYATPMGKDYADVAELCGVFDVNVGRARLFVEKCGVDMPVYENFDKMIEETRPDYVIVTTVDAYHSDYIIRSLELGCNVITEKPMTIDDQRCNAILEAKEKYGKEVIVTFNYRFAPFKTKIRELIADGAIGDVYSVHFEWLLDRVMQFGAHGTSYFRRWNARMAKSGGLLVHKSTHHFDLINWWIGQKPQKVSAFGQLRKYGAKNYPFEGGYTKGQRCSNCPHAHECEFYFEPDEAYRRLYMENEQYDGYMCDNCIYADDIDIYDTMGVSV